MNWCRFPGYLLPFKSRKHLEWTNPELHTVLTDEGIDDVPLLHLGFCDGSIIGTSHFDEPGCSHYWNSVFCQVAKDLFLLAKDGYLYQNKEGEITTTDVDRIHSSSTPHAAGIAICAGEKHTVLLCILREFTFGQKATAREQHFSIHKAKAKRKKTENVIPSLNPCCESCKQLWGSPPEMM